MTFQQGKVWRVADFDTRIGDPNCSAVLERLLKKHPDWPGCAKVANLPLSNTAPFKALVPGSSPGESTPIKADRFFELDRTRAGFYMFG
jgi:hypothetical protein